MTDPDPEQDGITHVNVYSQGRTGLGRFLSNFHRANIRTDSDGDFMSIEGYWYWLRCADDRLRRLSGYEAKRVGRELVDDDQYPEPEYDDAAFRTKICRAIALKLCGDRQMLDELRGLPVPLDHYYVMRGHVVRPERHRWVIEYLEWIRGGMELPYERHVPE